MKQGCRIKYEYIVQGKTYHGVVGVDCSSIFKKKIGQKITVFYSSKNAQFSQVNLGKLDKYRSTIYMIE